MSALHAGPSTWEHYEYGKLVQSPEGPIVPGYEHGCTGRSRAFSMELEAYCHPSKIGLGERDASRWAQCKWSDVGGVVSGVAIVNGKPIVVAVRQRERSESGEGLEGRLYTEAHYATIAAQNYGPHSLERLARELYAIPRQVVDTELPPLVIAEQHAEHFGPSWFDQASVFLRAVMSGVSVSVQDWNLRPEQFLQLLSVCLAAVPVTLQWRLPLGAGLMTIESATAIAHGMVAIGGLRIIGGEPKNPGDFDFALGDAYLRWLTPLIKTCQSPTELSEVVARELPRFATFDAIDVDKSWIEAAKRIASTLSEKEFLEQSLRAVEAGESVATPVPFAEYRQEYLEGVYERLHHRAHALNHLAEAAELGWNAEWQRFVDSAPDSRNRDHRLALSMLLGALPVTRPELLVFVRHIELPAGSQTRAVTRLEDAFIASDSGHLAQWLPLFNKSTEQYAGWFGQWRTTIIPRAVWAAIREALSGTGGKSPLLNAIADTPLGATGVQLLRGDVVSMAELTTLIAAAEPGDVQAIDGLVDRLLNVNVTSAFVLAQLAADNKLQPKLARSLLAARRDAVDAAYAETVGAALLKELQQRNVPSGQLMLRALLTQHKVIKGSAKNAAFRTELARSIGDPYATVLLDSQPVGATGASEEDAAAIAANMQFDAGTIDNLIGQWNAFGTDAETRAARIVQYWLTETATVSLERYPATAAVWQLSGKNTARPFKLTVQERTLVAKVVAALRLPRETMWEAATDEPLMDIVANSASTGNAPLLTAAQLAALLKATLMDERIRNTWGTRIRSRQWDRSPGWRLITGQTGQMAEVEISALRTMKGGELVKLLVSGIDIPSSLVKEVMPKDVDLLLGVSVPFRNTEEHIRGLARLLELSAREDRDSVTKAIGVIALQIAAREKMKKADVVKAVAEESGLMMRVMPMLRRKPDGPVELLRAVAKALRTNAGPYVERNWGAGKGK